MNIQINRPDIDYSSPDWDRTEQWMRSELQDVYKRLAGLRTSPEETQQLRGRASLLQQMLDFRDAHAAFLPHNHT